MWQWCIDVFCAELSASLFFIYFRAWLVYSMKILIFDVIVAVSYQKMVTNLVYFMIVIR